MVEYTYCECEWCKNGGDINKPAQAIIYQVLLFEDADSRFSQNSSTTCDIQSIPTNKKAFTS